MRPIGRGAKAVRPSFGSETDRERSEGSTAKNRTRVKKKKKKKNNKEI